MHEISSDVSSNQAAFHLRNRMYTYAARVLHVSMVIGYVL